jgi:hypothetical protein
MGVGAASLARALEALVGRLAKLRSAFPIDADRILDQRTQLR